MGITRVIENCRSNYRRISAFKGTLILVVFFLGNIKGLTQGVTPNPSSAFQTETLAVTFTGTGGATFSQLTDNCGSNKYYIPSNSSVYFQTFTPTFHRIYASGINPFADGSSSFTAQFSIPSYAPATPTYEVRIGSNCVLTETDIFTVVQDNPQVTTNPTSASLGESLTVTFTGTGGAKFGQFTETCINNKFWVSTSTVSFQTLSPTTIIYPTSINPFSDGATQFSADFDIPGGADIASYDVVIGNSCTVVNNNYFDINISPPAAPVLNAASDITQSSATLNWSSVSGATGYELDVSTDGFSTRIPGYDSKSIAGISEDLTGLDPPGIAYQARVRATNAGGPSVDSNPIGFTTIPPDPVSSVATAITQTSFSANWAAATSATDYILDVASDAGFIGHISGSPFSVGNFLTKSVTGLTAGTNYYYRVRAVNATGTSGSSGVQTLITIPGEPTLNAATNISATAATISWSPVIGAASYEIDVSLQSDFSSILTAYNSKSVIGTSEDLVDLTTGTQYYVRLRAVNTSGTSGNSGTETFTTSSTLNTETDFTAFSFSEQTGAATINTIDHTIGIEVAFGADPTSLVATFTLSAGATAKVGATDQESGTTPNDFTNDVIYEVKAEDGSTIQNWTVSATVAPNTEANIVSFSFSEQADPAIINTSTRTVNIEVLFGTDLTSLIATFALSSGGSAVVNGTAQVSGTTANDFSSAVTYTITAEDGTTTQDWTVNVTVAQNSATDFLTYSFTSQTSVATINTIDHTISIEVAIGTNVTSLVANFTLSTGASTTVNGNVQFSGTTALNFSNPVVYRISAEDGTVQDWTVTVTIAPNIETDFISFSFPQQTAAAVIDAVNHAISIDVTSGTDRTNLIATFSLSPGATASIGAVNQTSGTTANDFASPVTYGVTAEDGATSQNWVVTVTSGPGPSNEAEITTFGFQGISDVTDIDETNLTIASEVPFATDVSSLIAEFTMSSGATASVAGITQVSGTTSNNFAQSLTYLVTAEDGTTSKNWVVSVTIGTDATDPQISYSGIPTACYSSGSSSVTIQVVATDNIGIKTVAFHHKKARQADAQMQVGAATSLGNDTWSFDITESMLDDLGITYFFRVTDLADNTAQTTTNTMCLELIDPGIPSSVLGFGGDAEDWKMFSIPYVLSNNSISSIFESVLGSYDDTKWRIVHYDNTQFVEYKSGLSVIERGKGYWFNSRNNASFTLGNAKTPTTPATIQLRQGWNQIGNPYPFTIGWTQVLQVNNAADVVGDLRVFNGTSLTNATTLASFSGAYVNATEDITLTIPFDISSSSIVKENANSLDQPSWQVNFILKAGAFSNEIAGVGMDPKARNGIDPLDDYRVPRFNKYIDISFLDIESKDQFISKNFVPASDYHEWTFELQTNIADEPVSIHWDNSTFGKNNADLLLLDTENQRIINLREQDSYRFAGEKRTFKLIFSRIGEIGIGPVAFLDKPYPNPFNTSTVVGLILPGENDNFIISYKIIDVVGSQAVVLGEQKSLKSGFHEITWDGLGIQSREVPDGFYMIVVQVTGEKVNASLTQKILKR